MRSSAERSELWHCRPCAKQYTLDRATADADEPCPDCGAWLQRAAEVFISHASQDLQQALDVAATLRASNITVWLDKHDIPAGSWFVTEVSSGLLYAKAVVLILSSHAIESPWVDKEISRAIALKLPILPLKIEQFALPEPWQFLLQNHQWEEAFDRAVLSRPDRWLPRVKSWLLKRAAQLPKVAAAPLEPVPLSGVDPDFSPYAGPQPFGADMTDRFFGRHKDAAVLLEKIAQSRFMLVYAPSGAGKTSLLRTLIARQLQQQGLEVLPDARVGAALPSHVPKEKLRNVFVFSAIDGLDGTRSPPLHASLPQFLRSLPRRPGARGRVIVLDQFEELFTQHRDRFEDREEFFGDLHTALEADPTLRVILAMRQEFLADLDPLVERFRGDVALARHALPRVGQRGALEAVTLPAAEFAAFAEGVAERIVNRLNTIKVRRSDGTVVEKPGEFIELVHLQIVCDRLWKRLPKGLTRIEMHDIERAAGDGKTIDEFVVTALDSFYDDTIEEIAQSAKTRAHGHFPKELIRLGCMKFVTPAATRTMVQRANGRTGRLPDWIVEQLEDRHLLRAEQRGGQRWYELSHDLLTEPVGRQLDREVSALLFASDLLNRVLDNELQVRGGKLSGYFGEHRDVLVECRPFHGQAALFPDEAEFLFRTSLAAGQDMTEWSRRLALDFPDVRSAVLREALASTDVRVRLNTAVLLRTERADDLHDELLALAVDDPETSVRRAAAISLARLDDPAMFARLLGMFDDPANSPRALEALAQIQMTVDAAREPSAFEAAVAASGRSGRRIRAAARARRLREGMPVFPFVFVPAAGFAAVTAAAFKWIPASFNWSFSQANASAGMGVFHGLMAGIVWAGFIALGITCWHVLYGKARSPKSIVRPGGAIVAGAASGFVSSLLVVLMVVGVYTPESLNAMGWIGRETAQALREGAPAPFWTDLFVTYRCGWVYLIQGTGLGVGMALVTNGLLASPRWHALLASGSGQMASFAETLSLVRRIMRIVAPYAWLVPVCVALASVGAALVPDFSTFALSDQAIAKGAVSKGTFAFLVKGLIGDGLTQSLGAYFGVCGLALGVLVMRRGLALEPRGGNF